MFVEGPLQYVVIALAFVGILAVGMGLILLRFRMGRQVATGLLCFGALLIAAALVGYAVPLSA